LRADLHELFGTTVTEPEAEEEPDSNALRDLIIAILLLFFLLGSKKQRDELTDADRALIQAEVDLFDDSLDTIVARVGSGADVTGTVERLVSQATKLYWIAFVTYIDDLAEYRWDIDPAKDSCETCLNLDGVVQTGEEWRLVMEEQGIYPRSPNLACTGRFCGCELNEV
jgi:hypothetical protein